MRTFPWRLRQHCEGKVSMSKPRGTVYDAVKPWVVVALVGLALMLKSPAAGTGREQRRRVATHKRICDLYVRRPALSRTVDRVAIMYPVVPRRCAVAPVSITR